MNTQLNTIFSKVQFKTTIVYFLSFLLILIASGAKIYLDVKKEKEFLVQIVLNSKALDHYNDTSKEIEKIIQEVKSDGFSLYKISRLDVYYLNDNGSALYWVSQGSEKTILNRSDISSIPTELNTAFKNLNFRNKQTIKNWFIIRIKPNSNLKKSIALCIPEYQLWMRVGQDTLPIVLASIFFLTLLFILQNSSISYWIKRPLSKFMKHLEYKSQGIKSELERDVPEEWQEIFMEYNLSHYKDIIHEGHEEETEEEATKRYHAQLQELRWAKEQLATYQKKESDQTNISENKKLLNFFNTFENAQVGIMIADADTIPIFVNQKGKDFLGKGILPNTEEDLLDIRKIFIEGTDVEMPNDQHPMIVARNTNHPKSVRHIETFNPDTNERRCIQMFATPISTHSSMTEYYLILINKVL